MKCPHCSTENPADSRFCKKCATDLDSPESSATQTLETTNSQFSRGTLFADRYEIIEEIGKGGMGRVYRVEDRKIEEDIALKIIKPEIASKRKTIDRFRNELKLARRIAHRNVCRMFDLGEEQGTHYITMEYVPGEDLKSSIRRMGPLTLDKILFIAKQITDGLSEAHRLGIVHRDLKPQNIIIDKEGNARIMDFGIARSTAATGLTQTGAIIGTPEYMSPEQAEAGEVDQRSDIYSLGVILYEMATGRVPFPGETPFAVAMKHKTEAPPDPRKSNFHIPEELRRVILKCLEKNPKKRYQNTRELLIHLNKVTPAAPETNEIQESRTQNSIAVLPFKNMSADPEQDYFCEGLSEELINTLTQIDDLRVVARTSAFHFKGKEIDIREIGAKLNVETVLEGSVRKSGNRLRITAQLVNVADGYHLWSERFDREMADIFDIQDEISLTITDKLKIKLLIGDKTKLTKRHTKDLSSYNTYLKALYLRRRLKGEDVHRSIELFHQAIDEDPDNALAWAGLAYAHMVSCFYGGVSSQDALPPAVEAAAKALELDAGLAEAYEARSAISAFLEWDWKAGIKYAQKAIELNPGYAWGYFHLASDNMYMGNFEECFRLFRKAIELDPLNPAFHRNLGCAFVFSGDADTALEIYQRLIGIDPQFAGIRLFSGLAYIKKGMYEEAIRELQLEKSFSSTLTGSFIGVVYSLMDRKKEARATLDRYIKMASQDGPARKEEISGYGVAALCFSLEEIDLGFEWLERAYEERDLYLHQVKIDFLMDRVRSDPRLVSIVKKINLD